MYIRILKSELFHVLYFKGNCKFTDKNRAAKLYLEYKYDKSLYWSKHNEVNQKE